MDNPEPTYIVCMPVGDPRSSLVPGSTKVPCAHCKRDAWLSPATARSVPPETTVICLPCAQAKLRTLPNGEPLEVYITSESLQEARETLINRERRN